MMQMSTPVIGYQLQVSRYSCLSPSVNIIPLYPWRNMSAFINQYQVHQDGLDWKIYLFIYLMPVLDLKF